MGNVDTDKLKQLLYAMIETLDGDNSPSPSPETETPQESPNKQVVNNVRKKKYGTQENLFLSMPEKDMHLLLLLVLQFVSMGYAEYSVLLDRVPCLIIQVR